MAIESTRTANSVNTALREEIISQLHFDEEFEITDLDDALLLFSKKGYLELKKYVSGNHRALGGQNRWKCRL